MHHSPLFIRGFHPTYLVAVGIGILAVVTYLITGDKLTVEESKKVPYGKIYVGIACAIGLFNIISQNLMFPDSLIGIDTWTHMARTMNTPNWEYIGSSYSLMHAWLRGIIELTGMSYKWASVLFWGGIQTVSIVLMVYLIGKALFNEKTGIMSALMVACAGWVIQWGQWPIPNAMGALYALAAAYLWIKAYQTEKYWLGVLSLVLIPISLFTHLIAGVWVVGTIFVMSGPVMWQFIKNRKTLPQNLSNLAVVWTPLWAFFGVAGWYSHIHASIANFDGLDPSSGLTYALGQAPLVVSTTATPIANAPVVTDYLSSIPELTFNSLGFFLFMGVGIIGLFMMLRKSGLNWAYVALTLGTLAIGIIPSMFGFSVIEHRWWFLAQVFMSVPLGTALISLAREKLLISLAAVIVTLSIIGLPANTVNRTVSHNQIVRYALTDEEIEAYAVAESYSPAVIGSDPLYTAMIRGVNHYRDYYGFAVMIDNEILTGDYTGCRADVIILRDSLLTEPWGYGSGRIYRLEGDLIANAEAYGYKEVWSNEATHVLKRG